MSGKRRGPQKLLSRVVREMTEWAAQRGREYDNPGRKTAEGESGTGIVTHFNCWALYLWDIQQNSSTFRGNEEGETWGGGGANSSGGWLNLRHIQSHDGRFRITDSHAYGAVFRKLFKRAWTCSQKHMQCRAFYRRYIIWINVCLKALNTTLGSNKMPFYPRCPSTQTPRGKNTWVFVKLLFSCLFQPHQPVMIPGELWGFESLPWFPQTHLAITGGDIFDLKQMQIVLSPSGAVCLLPRTKKNDSQLNKCVAKSICR